MAGEMVELETDRLLLRQFTLDDLDIYHQRIFGDPQVMKTLPPGKPVAWQQTQALLLKRLHHWQHYGFGLWALVYKPDQQLIGQCGLQRLEGTAEVELAYAIAQQYWNQGLTTEAAQASISWGFESLSFNRIVAMTQPTNHASQRIMQKLGMQYEKQAHYYGLEVVCYAITRQLFQPLSLKNSFFNE